MAEDPKDIQEKIDSISTEMAEPNFWASKARSEDLVQELAELKEKIESEKHFLPQKDIFLIITSDATIFNPSLPSGRLVADIASLVPELHIIYIGLKWQKSKKINNNTFLYTAQYIPFLNFFTAYQVILSQLVWQKRFLPTVIISIGDELNIVKRFAKKYNKSFYVFYSYIKVLGNSRISMTSIVNAYPDKIIVPNVYVAKALKNHRGYEHVLTQIKIINEYIDVPELESLFRDTNFEEEAISRNTIFKMIVFPRKVNLKLFLTLRNINKGILSSIKKFEFVVVVKKKQFLQAKLMSYFFKIPIAIHKEDKDSINLFRTSRVMLYFDNPKFTYEPIFYSFVAGCPVVSSGDEYSKIILFDSGLEEFGQVEKNGKAFSLIIKKLINDQYLYTKYKANCMSFAKTAFTHDHEAYLTELKKTLGQ